ncbi:hypothetical protein ACFQJ7_05620 [Halovenus rubra]|uniref:Uncharacterized protein n=2 Tax=Halovenus rubra TaxID=869890 RepID=A0ABD5X6I0_9EURY|nr:hypothetical protein [Halovenus rubra]
MRRALIVIVLAVTLAGCTGSILPTDEPKQLEAGVGEIDGIGYEQDLSVEPNDGLNQSELDLIVDRTMARIEVIRGLTFKQEVDLTLQTRQEYKQSRQESETDETARAWENRIWEAQFIGRVAKSSRVQ